MASGEVQANNLLQRLLQQVDGLAQAMLKASGAGLDRSVLDGCSGPGTDRDGRP